VQLVPAPTTKAKISAANECQVLESLLVQNVQPFFEKDKQKEEGAGGERPEESRQETKED